MLVVGAFVGVVFRQIK